MTENNRASQRVETNIDILFRESGAYIKSHTLNVSNGGLFVETENPLPIDSVVTLSMRIPGETEPTEIQGCVVWSNPKSKNNAFPSVMGTQFKQRIESDVFG
jgi:type IV pilus assembly protein PilZ